MFKLKAFFLFWPLFFFLFSFPGYSSSQTSQTPSQVYARRLQAHLLVGDIEGGVDEARRAIDKFPDEALIGEWAVRTFAAAGREDEMLKAWSHLYEIAPSQAMGQNILEEMCWGILNKGKKTASLSTQLIALIGAALTHDIRALAFLLEGLKNPNAQIREIAVELAAHYGDYPLRKELGTLFYQESVLDVRLALFKAFGKLQMDEFLEQIVQCVADDKNGPREKLAAIAAIVLMKKSVDLDELELLASSPHAGLRQLACEVIIHCHLEEHTALLVKLMNDSQPEVCSAALRAWGFLRKGMLDSIEKKALHALDPEVGVTASWVWLISEPEKSEKALLKWLGSDQAHVRAMAASAIAKAGPYGLALAKKILKTCTDPYVKLNLSLGLLGQREMVDEVCLVLEECLESRQKWMFSEESFFKTIEKSHLTHRPAIPNYPEIIDQTVRLEILNLLAILESPNALKLIKKFLATRKWGVTGLAAEMLLGEGDESAINLVRELLEDQDKEIRLEAALALATWGKDFSAIPVLLSVYPQADRQLKLKILESLGHIGDRSAIPFLIERFKEPSLLIRIVAASVLIQILNH